MGRPAAAEHGDTVAPGVRWCRTGALLLATLAGAHLAALRDWHARAGYLDAGLAAVAFAAIWVAGALAVRGSRRDWQRATVLSATAAGAYLVSRGLGWPGASAAIGRWRSPGGLAALAADLLVLAVCGAALRWGVPSAGVAGSGWPGAVTGPLPAGCAEGSTRRER